MSEYICKKCGDTNIENFYVYIRKKCKKCKIEEAGKTNKERSFNKKIDEVKNTVSNTLEAQIIYVNSTAKICTNERETIPEAIESLQNDFSLLVCDNQEKISTLIVKTNLNFSEHQNFLDSLNKQIFEVKKRQDLIMEKLEYYISITEKLQNNKFDLK